MMSQYNPQGQDNSPLNHFPCIVDWYLMYCSINMSNCTNFLAIIIITNGIKEKLYNDGKFAFWNFLPLNRDYIYHMIKILRNIPNVKLDARCPYKANVLLVYGYL